MKLISILIVSLFVSVFSFAQNSNRKNTDNHIQIEGTNLFIIPPAGFVQEVRFLGLRDSLSDVIILIQKNRKSIIDKGNAKNYKSQGRQMYQLTKREGNIEYQFLEIELTGLNEYYFIETKYSVLNTENLSEKIKKSYSSVIVK